MENFLGMFGATISFVLWLPQALLVWRQRENPAALAGVSLGTQVLIVVNATVWGLYAYVTGAFWSGAPGIVNLPLALLTGFFVLRAKKQMERVDKVVLVDREDGVIDVEAVEHGIPVSAE